eukprot:TRINITY_DN642_c0_g2_i1.p1 TRINITY_DN642_c0_g2~~TRINITY_DN642_c0_g2_i1.p1  ORF type:complete len:685 (+),score=211.84 TRINITY_DN642_c0_g2_i1:53-2056(+)
MAVAAASACAAATVAQCGNCGHTQAASGLEILDRNGFADLQQECLSQAATCGYCSLLRADWKMVPAGEERVPWHHAVDHCKCERCGGEFGFVWRFSGRAKHHCRGCGRVVCADCSSMAMQVPGYGGARVRVCGQCARKAEAGVVVWVYVAGSPAERRFAALLQVMVEEELNGVSVQVSEACRLSCPSCQSLQFPGPCEERMECRNCRKVHPMSSTILSQWQGVQSWSAVGKPALTVVAQRGGRPGETLQPGDVGRLIDELVRAGAERKAVANPHARLAAQGSQEEEDGDGCPCCSGQPGGADADPAALCQVCADWVRRCRTETSYVVEHSATAAAAACAAVLQHVLRRRLQGSPVQVEAKEVRAMQCPRCSNRQNIPCDVHAARCVGCGEVSPHCSRRLAMATRAGGMILDKAALAAPPVVSTVVKMVTGSVKDTVLPWRPYDHIMVAHGRDGCHLQVDASGREVVDEKRLASILAALSKLAEANASALRRAHRRRSPPGSASSRRSASTAPAAEGAGYAAVPVGSSRTAASAASARTADVFPPPPASGRSVASSSAVPAALSPVAADFPPPPGPACGSVRSAAPVPPSPPGPAAVLNPHPPPTPPPPASGSSAVPAAALDFPPPPPASGRCTVPAAAVDFPPPPPGPAAPYPAPACAAPAAAASDE